MLRKSYIEKEIRNIAERAEAIGLSLNSFIVKDPKVIRELEKCDVGPFHLKQKPSFISPKNYRRGVCEMLGKDECGRLFGIKFLKVKG